MTVTWDLAALVQMTIAFVLPLVVGLVTKQSMDGRVKALLLAGLNLVLALLTELGRALAAGETFDLGIALTTALPAFIVSVGGHYGLWKPTGASYTVQTALVKDAPQRELKEDTTQNQTAGTTTTHTVIAPPVEEKPVTPPVDTSQNFVPPNETPPAGPQG